MCGNSKDGYLATVATDPTGDAINPSGAGESTSDADIIGVTMQSTGGEPITTLKIASLPADPPIPIAGTSDTYYDVAWQTAGTWWAALATEPQSDSLAFSYGNLTSIRAPISSPP